MTDSDPRALLVLKPFKNLSDDEILQMRAYKSKLNRIKNISTMPIGANGKSEFINRNTERMRKSRQIIKEQKNKILQSNDISILNEKQLQIVLNDKLKQIKLLETNIQNANKLIPKKIIEKTYSEKNIIQYNKIIYRVHIELTKSEIDTEYLGKVFSKTYINIKYKYLIDTMPYLQEENIPDLIKHFDNTYLNINKRKAYITPFVVLCSIITQLHNSYEILTSYMQSLIKESENKRNDYDISFEDSKKIIDFQPVEILDSIEDITQKLIFSIYTLILPRRLQVSNV